MACGGSAGATATGSSTAATAAPATASAPPLGPADVTVQAADGGMTGAPPKFLPATIEIKSGGVLRLDDTGTTEHNLTIDTTGLIPTSKASRSDRLLIAVDLVNTAAEAKIDLPPGVYRFYCSIDFGIGAGHTSLKGTGMVGTLTVH